MKKHKLLFLGAALAAMPFVASAQADTPFDPSRYDGKTHSRSDRVFTSFTLNNTNNSLGETKFNVNQPTGTAKKDVYKDLTGATPFVTTPGATVEFSEFTWNGIWMHGYLYIDVDGDGGFNTYLNDVNYPANAPDGFDVLRAPDGKAGDIMSFSCYNIATSGETWVNSKGGTADAGVQITKERMPGFVIPSNIKPGPHLALLKIDWSSLDQHGNPASDNPIENNGGCAVLFYVNIVTDRTITIESNNEAYGTVAFKDESITGNTHEFNASEAAIVVATANPGYVFRNWTKDGEVVSTNAEYTVDIYDEVFTLTANFVSEDEKSDDKFDWDRYDQLYSTAANSSGRILTSFTLSDGSQSQKFEINQKNAQGVTQQSIRFDKRDVVFNTTTGSTVDFSEFEYNGAWRDACLFIDYNGDEGFNSILNNTGLNLSEEASSYFNVLTPSPRGELVAFSSHEFADGVFFNSQGSTTDKNGNELNSSYFGTAPCLSADNMPSFTIPDWVETGNYMAFLKIAWGDLDQHPVATKWEDGISMGGCAVLFTIHIEKDTSGVVDIEEAATVAPRYYNIQGIEVAQPTSAGIYIVRQGNKVSKVYVK